MHLRLVLIAVCVAAAGVSPSCNPKGAMLQLFHDYAMNLLTPAATYVETGGYFVRPKGGKFGYVDPVKKGGGAGVDIKNFQAAIYGQTSKQKFDFSTALGLVKFVLPGSFNITGESSREVTLKQINMSGKRIAIDELEALVNDDKAAVAKLAGYLKKGADVFVVQEVFSTDAIELSTADGKALSVAYGDGKAVADCTAKGTGATKEKQAGKQRSGEATQSGKNASTEKAQLRASGTSLSHAQKDSGQKPSDTKQSQAGFGVCKSTEDTLKFASPSPGQFFAVAVRLKKLTLEGGRLVVDLGAYAPEGGGQIALGRAERYALVDPKNPVISGFEPQPKR